MSKEIDYGKWAEITIERWKERMKELKIHSSGELFNSFKAHVEHDANGNLAKIAFTFHFYGWYVNAGVGNGYKHGNGGNLIFLKDWKTNGKHRHAKPWYDKIYWREFNRLVAIAAEHYGELAAEQIRQFEVSEQIWQTK